MLDDPITPEEREVAEQLQDARNAAAAFFLEDEDAPEPMSYDDCAYDAAGGITWLILTNEEADERAFAYVRENLWAFRSEFLVNYVPEGVTEEVLQMIGEKCEDGNPSMLALVGDRLQKVAEDAISSDGRGPLLSNWDGEEHEFDHAGRLWFAYRN